LKNSLIYLPGFNSGPQSEKSAQLKLQFPQLAVASYDSWNPDNGYRQIDALFRPDLDKNLVLIGSSLGGFWAYQFAKKYGLKCVLLNPCMSPEITLKPFIGAVENMYSKKKGVLKPEYLLRYSVYRFSGGAQCTVLHEKGDELIPYRESVENFAGQAKLVLLEGGSHRFVNVQRAIEEIKALQSAPIRQAMNPGVAADK
jgi:hypothetical protein